MQQIISASRRTDIPAFYADWLVNRLHAGQVLVKNPYSHKVFSVSLRPDDVSAIVFWSKNYAPLLEKLDAIEKTTKNLFFHFTITANAELELHAPDYREAIKDYLFIARRYSAAHIIWRYDPVCVTDKLSFEVHEERFVECAKLLKGHATRCILSFVHPYKKTLANMQRYSGPTLVMLTEEKKKKYALRLAEKAAVYGIQLYACCNDVLLAGSILKASCIDGRYLSALFNQPVDLRSAMIRKECACTRSMDIGAYDTCAHGCLYCYANADMERAKAAQQYQMQNGEALGMKSGENILRSDTAQETLFP